MERRNRLQQNHIFQISNQFLLSSPVPQHVLSSSQTLRDSIFDQTHSDFNNLNSNLLSSSQAFLNVSHVVQSQSTRQDLRGEDTSNVQSIAHRNSAFLPPVFGSTTGHVQKSFANIMPQILRPVALPAYDSPTPLFPQLTTNTTNSNEKIQLATSSSERSNINDMQNESVKPIVLGKLEKEKKVHLLKWGLKLVDVPGYIPNSNSWFVVNGICTIASGDQIRWHSSPIRDRITPNEILTVSGKIYYLDGDLNVEAMKEDGYSESFCEEFLHGFPDNWKELLVGALPEIEKFYENTAVETMEADEVDGKDEGEEPGHSTPPTTQAAASLAAHSGEICLTRSGRKVKPPGAWWAVNGCDVIHESKKKRTRKTPRKKESG
ncbi:11762_t:CDS:2 [Ambispora leptoticha]|uniref:11762_t:CDS:1 n=1 Tax=Ambispora leptoticha TaxID=144679 RepID=A0A9N8VBG6_9GLOM|nr:11762_t:CDS:2 [Ambispora leptoticha]